MKVQLEDDDYVLSEGAAWIEVDGFAIRIHSDNGVVAIEAYEPQEGLSEPFQSMYLHSRAPCSVAGHEWQWYGADKRECSYCGRIEEAVQSMHLRQRAEKCAEHRWECINDSRKSTRLNSSHQK